MLNPIEEAWGLTKAYVAKENRGDNFQAVKKLIFDGFTTVTPEIWSKLVRRTEAWEQKMIRDHHILLDCEVQPLIIDLDSEDDDGYELVDVSEVDDSDILAEMED